jgi:hypothetical protein
MGYLPCHIYGIMDRGVDSKHTNHCTNTTKDNKKYVFVIICM